MTVTTPLKKKPEFHSTKPKRKQLTLTEPKTSRESKIPAPPNHQTSTGAWSRWEAQALQCHFPMSSRGQRAQQCQLSELIGAFGLEDRPGVPASFPPEGGLRMATFGA